jgi:hypothetical protein
MENEKPKTKSKKVLIGELLELKKDNKEWLDTFSYNQLMRGWNIAQLVYEINREGKQNG